MSQQYQIYPDLFDRLIRQLKRADGINHHIVVTKKNDPKIGIACIRGELFSMARGHKFPLSRKLIEHSQRIKIEKVVTKLFMKTFNTGDWDAMV